MERRSYKERFREWKSENRNLYKKEEENIRFSVLRLILLMSGAVSLVSMLVTLLIHTSSGYTVIMLISLMLNLLLFFRLSKCKHSLKICILTIILENFFCFPAFFLMGGGGFSGAAFFMVFGIMATGFLLPGMHCFSMIMLEIAFDGLFIRELYRKTVEPVKITSTEFYFLDLVSMYLLVTVFVLWLVWEQNHRYQIEHQKVMNSQRMIEKTGEAKGQFLANMSHEIRTPMNAVIGLTDIMLAKDLDKSIKYDLNTIRKSSDELLTIIDDVLSYSRLDSGNFNIPMTEFRMDQLLQSTIDIISHEIGDKNIDISLKVDHQIPSVLYGSGMYIKRVFMYLLFASLEYMDEGRIIFEVSLQEKTDDNHCVLSVRIADNGKGMSKFDLRVLTGSFHVYDTRQSSNMKGLGMKFRICKELIALMGGELTIESIEEVGLASTFTIPCEIRNADPLISVPNSGNIRVLVYLETDSEMRRWDNLFREFDIKTRYVRNKENFDDAVLEVKYDYIFLSIAAYEDLSDSVEKFECEEYTYVVGKNTNVYGDFGKCRILKNPVSGMSLATVLNNQWNVEQYSHNEIAESVTAPDAKVLVVDDNAVNLKVAKGVFKKYEIDIDMATSGMEALEKIEDCHYDIIFLDQMMPEMDGVQTLKRIRDSKDSYFSTVPIVALTASKGSDIRNLLTYAGFQEFIVKPIKMRYLEDVLKKYLPDGMIVMKQNIKEEAESKKAEKAKTEKEEKTKEIDKSLQVDKGMANLGNDESGYFAVMNTYYKEGEEKKKQIPDLLEVGDISLFTTNVHGIKSASAAIGAMYVSELFRQLEMAGKKSDMEFINAHIEEAMTEYTNMLEIVKNYLVERNAFEEPEASVDYSNMEVEELDRAVLEAFKTEVDHMNLKACDTQIVEICGKNYGDEINAKIQEMKKGYEGFDFHTVKKILNELLA